MSDFNEQIDEVSVCNLDIIMNNIEKSMNEINILEKTKASLKNTKTSIENFYTKFLIFVIVSNHFHTLIDTNYSLVGMLYDTINEVYLNEEVEEVEEVDYNIIDYVEGLEIDEVD